MEIPKTYDELLDEFHLKYGHYLSDHPDQNIPARVVNLRYKLIKEEVVEEFLPDLAYAARLREDGIPIPIRLLAALADHSADSVYVIVGTMRSFGIPFDKCFREVQRSNMTKTPPDPSVVIDPGEKYAVKTPKGPNFEPPRLEEIILKELM